MASIERVGSRVYVVGDSYAIKDSLKQAGCHWDSERRQWWIGAAKIDELKSILASPRSAQEENKDSLAVYSKCQYKGRIYYCVGRSRAGDRMRLTSLDGKIDFWADVAIVEVVKEYLPREYRGRVERQTLGSLRRFVDRAKQADREITDGRIPNGYCVDLEDGIVKRRSECDMPSV